MRPVHLILIGYNSDDVHVANAQKTLGTGTVSTIPGGHTVSGEELEPLDEEALRAVIENLPCDIEGIALSGFFSIRNPSHEIRAAKIIQEMRPDLQVSSGHQLTWELNAFKRATTASLNAGLIPIIIELIDALVEILKKHGVDAPLTVVRGDGTAVGESWAKLHPVEMLLSGPAASAVGAGFIAAQKCGTRNMWIADIGGTTTDIIALDDSGKPKISVDGATVGTHRTLVKSIDIFTFGQGGDSHVALQESGELVIGPMRIIPLCVAAETYPSVRNDLQQLARDNIYTTPVFVLPHKKRVTPDGKPLRLLEDMGDEPVSVYDLARRKGFGYVNLKYILKLASGGYIDIAGFTPTDAFHVMGTFCRWNVQASQLGADIMSHNKRLDIENLPQQVVAKMVGNIAAALFKKSIAPALEPVGVTKDMGELIEKSLIEGSSLHEMLKLHLNSVLVGAGAPAKLVIPQVAPLLNTQPVLADKAEVAGAIGAAVGTFAFSGVIRISHPRKHVYRVHHTCGINDYEDLELAVEKAQEIMMPWLQEQATAAGAQAPNIAMERHDITIDGNVYLWTELHFTVSA